MVKKNIEKIAMTEDEAWEWRSLRDQFDKKDIHIDGKSVFGVHFHSELVEEDKKYQYEGKIDDTPPGVRYSFLGNVEAYARYEELSKKIPPSEEWYKENFQKTIERKSKEMRDRGDRYWWV